MVRHHVTERHQGNDCSPPVEAIAFALSAGAAINAEALMYVDAGPDHGRRLLACVEPLEPSERGLELAALALATLRETFAASHSLPPAAALMKAFTAANAVLISENRPSAGCRWERRVYVGATGIVLAGREMIIAQVPPTVTMIVQDGHLYAFPELVSWRPDYLPATEESEPEPLGCREGTQPFLFRTTAATGDLITFCSTAIARHLGRGDAADLAPLLSGATEPTLDYLGDLVAAHELDDAHAAVIQVRRLAPERRLPRLSLRRGKHGQSGWPVIAPRVPSAQRLGYLTASDPAAVPRSRVAYAVRTDWGAVGIPLDRPLDFASRPGAERIGGRWSRLLLTANRARDAVAGLLEHLPSRPERTPPAPPIGFGARRGYFAAPGVGSVRRYRDQPSLPAEWRSHLPRGPEVHLPSRVFTVGLVLFLAFGGSGALLDRYRTQIAQADAALATVDGSLQAITGDPAAASAALAAAEVALAQARDAGADASTMQRQTLAVEAARDLAWGNLRLQDLTLLGSLPPALSNSPVQLARTGHDIWLVSGGLYGLDQSQHRLVQVLGPGDAVPSGEVHGLAGAASDGGHLVLVDDTALYARDDTGRWQRHFISPAASEVALGTMPLATYQHSFYALGPTGDVLKFPADGLTDAPEVWVSAADYPELVSSTDLVIDGQIHVLLRDGRVATFLRGTLTSTQTPDVTPSLAQPRQLLGGPDTNFLYIHDPAAQIGPTTGRLVRLDSSGAAVQILPPLPTGNAASGAHVLSTARDLVIDEAAGLVYLLTETEVWRAAIPR